VSLALAAAAASAEEPAQKQIKLAIQSQTLRDALNEWAQQTGFQLIFATSEETSQIVSPSVTGTLSAEAALSRLLAGTKLTYEWIGETSVAIREIARPVGSTSTRMPEASRAAPIRLAQLEGAQPASPQSVTSERPLSDARSGEDFANNARIGEIIVAGSRLRRPSEGPAPVTIFNRSRIEQLGVTNVADVLSYFPQQPFSTNEQTNFGGAREVRLRGLATGTTLVLLNGRRTVTSALQGGRNYFDLNTIPLAAVERIEVLSDSASAVHGADAVGGVINVVMKSSTEPSASIYYGASDGGAEERRASATIGHSGDRVRASVVLDYFDRGSLMGTERSRAADQDFRRFGWNDTRSTTANPGNVSSLTAANLPGLPSRTAAVPAGSTGVGLTPSSFLGTAGQTNLESLGKFASLVPESERRSAAGFLEVSLTNRIDAFAEFLYSKRDDTSFGLPPSLSNRTVPASNAFNPFGTSVAVNYLLTGIGPTETIAEAESYRGVSGVRGAFRSWDWEVAVLATKEDGSIFTANQLDATRVQGALASSDPAQALNVFQDGPGGSPEFLRFLVAVPIVNGDSSKASQAGAFVRGELLALPAGEVSAVLGAEWREEKIHFESLPTLAMDADRKSSSVYSELRVPILGADIRTRMLDSLILTLAGRYDDYSDFGGTFNPQYGLEWKMFPQLLLRGSYGTSFRAPSLFQLYQPGRSIASQVEDPMRSGQRVPVTIRLSGNPNLDPEESTSQTFGFVLTALESTALKLAASWWKVEQDQRVQTLNATQLLAAETFFPDRVLRNAPTLADVAVGRPGSLVSLDLTNVNFGSLETSGVDVQLSASFATPRGQVVPTVLATWVDEFRVIDLPGTPAVERVGVATAQQTIPKWRSSATLAWVTDAASVAVSGRYVPAYDDVASGVRNGLEVGSQTLIDLDVSVTLGEVFRTQSWLQGFTIRAGVKNIADEEPPFSTVTGQGYDPSQADLRQRFAYMTLSKAF
jgi:iron complex outermembrane recepter protein